jgi:RNA 3'-terminal phosphate cyclase (ATP)
MVEPIEIDGSQGEGGGQILRTSLALSIITGRPIALGRIRAGRQKPGLKRQHMTCVEAAAAISGAEVEGVALGSQSLRFRPGPVRPGAHHFAVGTAGSASLVLQTVLPPLLLAGAPSQLTLEGGTHNPMSPPYDFIARAFAPLLRRMGAGLELAMERAGFYPAGGGRFTAAIAPPAGGLRAIELLEAGPPVRRQARALLSRLPTHVGDRELGIVQRALGWRRDECAAETVPSPGTGNALVLEVERASGVVEVVTGFGEKGIRAEKVAEDAAEEMRRFLAADVPVGEHLADQLLLPMALAGAGRYRTVPLSLHATTNIDVIRRFLPVEIDVTEAPGGSLVEVRRR